MHDHQIHQNENDGYIEQMNHAPYGVIGLILMTLLCLFTLVVLIGIF